MMGKREKSKKYTLFTFLSLSCQQFNDDVRVGKFLPAVMTVKYCSELNRKKKKKIKKIK